MGSGDTSDGGEKGVSVGTIPVGMSIPVSGSRGRVEVSPTLRWERSDSGSPRTRLVPLDSFHGSGGAMYSPRVWTIGRRLGRKRRESTLRDFGEGRDLTRNAL